MKFASTNCYFIPISEVRFDMQAFLNSISLETDAELAELASKLAQQLAAQ